MVKILYHLSISLCRFMVANPDSLHIQPYRVSQVGFDSCSTDGGEAVLSAPTNAPFVVEDKYLRPGSNFFIGKPLYKTSFNWPRIIIPLPHLPFGYDRLFLFSHVKFFLLLSLATQFAMRNYSCFLLFLLSMNYYLFCLSFSPPAFMISNVNYLSFLAQWRDVLPGAQMHRNACTDICKACWYGILI